MTTDEIELFATLRPEATPLNDDQFASLRERALSMLVGVDGEGPMTINLTAMTEKQREGTGLRIAAAVLVIAGIAVGGAQLRRPKQTDPSIRSYRCQWRRHRRYRNRRLRWLLSHLDWSRTTYSWAPTVAV